MVKIKNLQRKFKVNSAILKKIATQILEIEGLSKAELSLVLVSDKRIGEINRLYLHQDCATDVIAFRMADGPYGRLNPYLLGDAVISVETARCQADKFQRTLAEEICLYLVHGILHLEGYDDRQGPNRQRMFLRQNQILNKIPHEDIKKIVA